MTTLNDVARAAGLSPTAVSRFLNGHLTLPDATVARIQAAIARLDYRPNRLARQLSTGKSATLGVVVADLDDRHADLVAAIEGEAASRGYDLHVAITRGDQGRIVRALDTLGDRLVEGLILAVDADDLPDALADRIRRTGQVLLLGGNLAGSAATAILPDLADAGRQAMQHLLQAGHRDIAAIAGPPDRPATRDWLAGIRSALAAADQPLPGTSDADPRPGDLSPDRLIHGDLTRASGLMAGQELAGRAQRPTAVLAASDAQALGAMQAFRQRGLSIPGDVSIIGCGDLAFADMLDPALTTIRLPMAEMGRSAVAHLLAGIAADGRPPARVVLPVSLIRRASVTTPAVAPPRTAPRGTMPTLPLFADTVEPLPARRTRRR